MAEPFPQLRRVPASFPYPLRREHEACVRLLETIHTLVGGPRDTVDPPGAVIHGEFVRGTNTFDAILQLSLFGLGLQAQMLLRPLFEGAITARWTLLHPDRARERYELHGRYCGMLLQQRAIASKLAAGRAPPDLITLTDVDLAEARRLFGPYGERGWTGESLFKMGEEVIAALGSEDAQMHLSFYLDVFHRQVNWNLHGGLYSVSSWTEGMGTDHPTAIFGPSERGVRDALDGARTAYRLVISAFDDWFHCGWAPRLESLYVEIWRAFQYDAIKAAGRNGACPCGSGKKYKHCHGQ